MHGNRCNCLTNWNFTHLHYSQVQKEKHSWVLYFIYLKGTSGDIITKKKTTLFDILITLLFFLVISHLYTFFKWISLNQCSKRTEGYKCHVMDSSFEWEIRKLTSISSGVHSIYIYTYTLGKHTNPLFLSSTVV